MDVKKKKYENDLKKFLTELEALGELLYGMIEYFDTCYDINKEIDARVILQAFAFIWDAHKEITNRYYPLIDGLIKKAEEQ